MTKRLRDEELQPTLTKRLKPTSYIDVLVLVMQTVNVLQNDMLCLMCKRTNRVFRTFFRRHRMEIVQRHSSGTLLHLRHSVVPLYMNYHSRMVDVDYIEYPVLPHASVLSLEGWTVTITQNDIMVYYLCSEFGVDRQMGYQDYTTPKQPYFKVNMHMVDNTHLLLELKCVWLPTDFDRI